MKKFASIILCSVLLAAVLAFSPFIASTSAKDDTQESGVIYSDCSERFEFTIFPAKVFWEDGQRNIKYSLTLDNKSEIAYQDFRVTFILSRDVDPYLLAGAFPAQLTPITLAAKSDNSPVQGAGKGVEINIQQLLQNEDCLKESGIEWTDILTIGQQFELKLEWRGGSEIHSFKTPVIDETWIEGSQKPSVE